jgi:hypothetical protein
VTVRRYTPTTRETAMTRSVQKEAGKTDKIVDQGTVTNVPEGEGEKTVKDGAYFINGRPVSQEEYEKSTA